MRTILCETQMKNFSCSYCMQKETTTGKWNGTGGGIGLGTGGIGLLWRCFWF